MGTTFFCKLIDSDADNDPSTVMIAPNLSGFNRVILSLPAELNIDDILLDLVENNFLNGVEEHERIDADQNYVIKRTDEQQVNALVAYLNNKYGFVAHKGYVKPSRNIVIDNQNVSMKATVNVARSGHIALVQSPIGKNPNEQFSAYRREYDPNSGFPKFERVDIEEVIHYTRPEQIANAANLNSPHFGDPFEQKQSLAEQQQRGYAVHQATHALQAMSHGQQFDVTETEKVKDREAIKIDYVEKIRKLRHELKSTKTSSMRTKHRLRNKQKYEKQICAQFQWDHMNNLVQLKRKKYGIERAHKIYTMQKEHRLVVSRMKQSVDPNIKASQYDTRQNHFWQQFDQSKN